MAPRIAERPRDEVPPGPGRPGTMGRLGPASFATPSSGLRRVSEVLKLAGDPNRLAILGLLGAGERSVTEVLAELPGLTGPSISRHLGLLRHCGLVEVRILGPRRIYSLTAPGRSLVRAAASLGRRLP